MADSMDSTLAPSTPASDERATSGRTTSPRAVIAGGMLTGLVGTTPIGRLTGWKRAVYCGAEAPLFAFAVSRMKELSVPQRVGIGGMAMSAAALGKTLGVTMDRRAEACLVGRGIARPRLVIGVVSGVVGAVWMAASGGWGGESSAPGRAGAAGSDSSEDAIDADGADTSAQDARHP